jgi:hypothetical protein
MNHHVHRKASRPFTFRPLIPSYIVTAFIFEGIWVAFFIVFIMHMPLSKLVLLEKAPALLGLNLRQTWSLVTALLIVFTILAFLARKTRTERPPRGAWAVFLLCLTLLLGLHYHLYLWSRIWDSAYTRDSALFGACYEGDPHDAIPLLLEVGAEPHLLNYYQQTALHRAVFYGVCPESIGLLLEHGANPMANDHWFYHPHDYLFLSGEEAHDLDLLRWYRPLPFRTADDAKAIVALLLEAIDDEQASTQAATDMLRCLYRFQDTPQEEYGSKEWRYSPEEAEDLTTFLIGLGADPSVIDR